MSKSNRFIVCISILLGLCASGSIAQQPAPTSATPAKSLEQRTPLSTEKLTWQRRMAVRPKPTAGCFTAQFPVEEWKVVKCGSPTKLPTPKLPPFLRHWVPSKALPQVPTNAPGLAVIGNGNDIVATAVGGTITGVEGFFDQTVDVLTVNSVLIDKQGVVHNNPGLYGLQINVAPFATPSACVNAQIANCQGWVQFLFFNNNSGSYAQMEIWLNNYGATCPGQGSIPQLSGMPQGFAWSNTGTDCQFFTEPTPTLAVQPVTSLGQLHLRAEAAAGGSDSVTIELPDGSISGFGISDELLKLSSVWQAAEFNVFGYIGGERAHFNSGAAAVVHVNVENGTTNAPIISNAGFTGETNTFNLVLPGCANAGNPPNVVFEEVTLDNQKSLACPPVIPAAPPISPQQQCQEATEAVAADEATLAKAQARRTTSLCQGPASFNCEQTVKADQAILNGAIIEKNKVCK